MYKYFVYMYIYECVYMCDLGKSKMLVDSFLSPDLLNKISLFPSPL